MDADQKLIEEQKLEIERMKLATEQQKLELERDRGRRESRNLRLTLLSLVAAVLIASMTVGYGAWSVLRTARSQFATKVADLVFSTNDPGIAIGKAQATDELFQEELSPQFVKKTQDPEFVKHFTERYPPLDPNLEHKMDLIKMIVNQPGKEKEILDVWEAMFSGDKAWLDEFHAARKK